MQAGWCVPLLLVVLLTARTLPAADRPNVVLIVADDLGYGELGCYGGTEIPTPNLDRLAQQGVRFTSGYVTSPFCAASRAGLLTGRYPTRFGFEYNPIGAKNAAPGIGLPAAEITLASRLRDAGYATGLIGKWHLGGTAEYHPQRRGFDEFFGFLHEGHYYVPPPWQGVTTWLRRKTLPDGSQGRWTSADGHTIWSTHMGHYEPDYDADNPLLRGSQPHAESMHLTDAFTREACGFIKRHAQQPFFLMLAYNAVHSPLQADNQRLAKLEHIPDIQRRLFAALLTQLDEGVGRVHAQLQESHIERNTLIIFLSDNGGPTRELTSSNRPLRGGKGELYEGGVRVPFIVSWPARCAASSTVNQPVISLDAAATILTAAGVSEKQYPRATASSPKDSVDLHPLLCGTSEQPPHASLYWRVGAKAALRHGSLKLVRMSGKWELFDLEKDLSESQDLSAEQPERTRQLVDMWEAWNAQQAQPLW
jgi:arylsulfatase B